MLHVAVSVCDCGSFLLYHSLSVETVLVFLLCQEYKNNVTAIWPNMGDFSNESHWMIALFMIIIVQEKPIIYLAPLYIHV